MKFSAREDIDGSIEDVFRFLTDFEAFERQAIRRNVDVQRTDSLRQPGVGMEWHTKFRLRGRVRQLDITLSALEPPNSMVFQGRSKGLHTVFSVDLIALSTSRTRMTVTLDLSPKTLPARLMVQSLKLTRKTITTRFKTRLHDFARTMESQLRSA